MADRDVCRLAADDRQRIYSVMRGWTRGVVCSAPWMELIIEAIEHGLLRSCPPNKVPRVLTTYASAGGIDLRAELIHAGIYPPGPASKRRRRRGVSLDACRRVGLDPSSPVADPMKRCLECGRWYPSRYCSGSVLAWVGRYNARVWLQAASADHGRIGRTILKQRLALYGRGLHVAIERLRSLGMLDVDGAELIALREWQRTAGICVDCVEADQVGWDEHHGASTTSSVATLNLWRLRDRGGQIVEWAISDKPDAYEAPPDLN